LLQKVKLGLALKRAVDHVKREAKMGKAKPAIVGIIGAIATAFAAGVFSACPSLKTALPSMLAALVGGIVTTYLLKPKENAGAKALGSGLLTGIGALALQQVEGTCPGLIANLPAIGAAAVTGGVGLYLKSPRQG
jgi:uncharacterized membrane protein YeaQ/YmgE (transglycosylase-associated protein family)